VTNTDSNVEEQRFAISLFSDQFDTEPLMKNPRYRLISKCFGRFEEREEMVGPAFSPVF
jgi:uncharacterized protein (DUF924 family)